jgi:signal transduction histidine kinase
MAESRTAVGTSWSPTSALLWPFRRVAGNIRVTVVLSVFLICGSFAAAAAIQMRNDRLHAIAEAAAFDSRRAREIALDLAGVLDRYAAIGKAFATATSSAETSAAISESGGSALRNIAVLNAKGRLESELTGSPDNILPLSAETLWAARAGHTIASSRDGRSFAIAFPAGGHIVAVELDARALLPSASDEGALLSTLSGEIVALGREWRALPNAEAVALRDDIQTSRVVDVADGRRLIALHRVQGWPLAAGTASEVGEALDAWYGALPLYFFFIFGPALAGAGLAVVFVREFERRARTNEAMKSLRTTQPGEVKLLVRLADAERRASVAETVQREFLSHMSHELRTPLNAIIGFSEVIEHGVFGYHEKYSDYAHDISSAGRELHDKLFDILEFSELKASLHEFSAEPIDIVKTLQGLVDETAESARLAGIRLALTFPTAAQAIGDPRAVKRILGKLIANALQYSKRGSTLRLRVRNRAEFVIIDVRDQGLGFTADELEKAVEPFRRFDRRGAETGAGMGLTVASLLAEGMGGTLRLDSIEGEGTTVELWLPRA